MKVVLITDSLSVLQSLTSGNPEENILRQLRQRKEAWNSSPKSELSYHEAKTLMRNKRLADFKHRNGGYNPQQYTLRLLSRHEQTMIFRLRTGHCRLRSHMKKDWHRRVSYLIMLTGSTNYSPCPAVMPSPQRRKGNHPWPAESSLGNKLHGTATNLSLTVRFIALTGLQI